MQVLPLTDPQVVEVFGLAHPSKSTVGQGLLLLLEVAPEVEQGREVGVLVLESRVLLIGLRLLVDGPLARVLDGEGGHDHEDLTGAATKASLDEHPTQPGIDREPRESLPVCREPASSAIPPSPPRPPPRPPIRCITRRVGRRGIHRISGSVGGVGGEGSKFFEQADAVGDLLGVRGIDERESGDVAEAEGGHLEDDRGEGGAQDLGFGEVGAGFEVGLGVEADADALGDAATAAGTLGGAGFADRLDGEALDLRALAVARDPRGAGVDDEADARDGQRGLGDVGGEDDATFAGAVEDAVLLGRREASEERQDLGAGQVEIVERVGGVSDLPLPREEHEDVGRVGARGDLGPEFLDGLDDTGDLIAFCDNGLAVLTHLDERAVARLDGEGPTADLEDGHLAHLLTRGIGGEMLGEALGVDGGRRDDDFQVRSAGQQLLEVAKDEVDVEAALVGLVDDDRVVAPQIAIVLHLVEEDAVGHHLDPGPVAAVVGEAHLITDDPG